MRWWAVVPYSGGRKPMEPSAEVEIEPTEQPESGAAPVPASVPELDDPDLYINRELSWMAFNDRVLQLADGYALALAERGDGEARPVPLPAVA